MLHPLTTVAVVVGEYVGRVYVASPPQQQQQHQQQQCQEPTQPISRPTIHHHQPTAASPFFLIPQTMKQSAQLF